MPRMNTTLTQRLPGDSRATKTGPSLGRRMLNKVPEVTVYFWVIKVLCTTVGETAADLMNDRLGFGLTNTTYVMTAVLIVALVAQFRRRRYEPGIYWVAVVLISIVGTLITDNLSDNLHVALEVTTIAFAIALAVTFAVWFAFERTLSIHTIFTTRREGFYWLAILFTFALGTAGGDLMSERLNLGYWVAVLIFGAAIAAVAVAHFGFKVNAVLTFWIAYILTRPLGASLGDGLSQARADGGLGLGTVVTSLIFLGAILALVVYLARSRVDQTATVPAEGSVGDAGLLRLGEPTDLQRAGGQPAAADAANVLVVADGAPATSGLLDVVRGRAARGLARFQLLVPNPHQADWHLHPDLAHADHFLDLAVPRLEEAAGAPVDGSASPRHDPMDAIEDALRAGDFNEIILSTHPHGLARWLHIDLPRRVEHLGLPVMTVVTA